MNASHFLHGFLALYALHHGFEAVLDALQLAHLRRKGHVIPAHLAGKVTVDDMRKAVAYACDKLKLSLVGRAYDATVLFCLVAFAFELVDRLISSLEQGAFVSSLCLLAALSLMQGVLELPFALYRTFVLEARHEMNRQTPKGFVGDVFKQLGLGLVLGGALCSALLGTMLLWDEWFVAPAAIAVIAFQLFVGWIFPVLLLPIFNKLVPVAAELAEKISALASKVGFPVAAVLSMDGSRRSVLANAFVAGFRRSRRIVLFDTLLAKMSHDEVLAVVAHELGHAKLRHIETRLALGALATVVAIVGLGLLRHFASLVLGFGFTSPSDGAVLIVFSLVLPELAFPLAWLGNSRSRRNEHAADRFAVGLMGEGANLREALIALSKQNKAAPTSHPLYRSYHASHPGLRARLAEIDREHKKLVERYCM
ncbi:MAG: M48 family metallopeptidase [Myxococcota bacterium]|jgi:STE24 endopeptidase|nr:M48 family metallopeptidase [Myxococcota bacterium]